MNPFAASRLAALTVSACAAGVAKSCEPATGTNTSQAKNTEKVIPSGSCAIKMSLKAAVAREKVAKAANKAKHAAAAVPTKVASAFAALSTRLGRHKSRVAPRCPSPTDSGNGTLARGMPLPIFVPPPPYVQKAYGSSDLPAIDLGTMPECLTHALAVVERWMLKAPGVYRTAPSMHTDNELVESYYDPATGSRLPSAPAFDLESADTAALAPAYARLAKQSMLASSAALLPLTVFRSVAAAQRAGASTPAQVEQALRDHTRYPALFDIVLNHLAKVAQHRAFNYMSGDALVRVWGPGMVLPHSLALDAGHDVGILSDMNDFAAAMGTVLEEIEVPVVSAPAVAVPIKEEPVAEEQQVAVVVDCEAKVEQRKEEAACGKASVVAASELACEWGEGVAFGHTVCVFDSPMGCLW